MELELIGSLGRNMVPRRQVCNQRETIHHHGLRLREVSGVVSMWCNVESGHQLPRQPQWPYSASLDGYHGHSVSSDISSFSIMTTTVCVSRS